MPNVHKVKQAETNPRASCCVVLSSGMINAKNPSEIPGFGLVMLTAPLYLYLENPNDLPLIVILQLGKSKYCSSCHHISVCSVSLSYLGVFEQHRWVETHMVLRNKEFSVIQHFLLQGTRESCNRYTQFEGIRSLILRWYPHNTRAMTAETFTEAFRPCSHPRPLGKQSIKWHFIWQQRHRGHSAKPFP